MAFFADRLVLGAHLEAVDHDLKLDVAEVAFRFQFDTLFEA